jgi:hypothetical protein
VLEPLRGLVPVAAVCVNMLARWSPSVFRVEYMSTTLQAIRLRSEEVFQVKEQRKEAVNEGEGLEHSCSPA